MKLCARDELDVVAKSSHGMGPACLRILDPLARVFLNLGVGAGEFATLCKIAYVRVAARDHQTANGRVNRSRIAVVTGLTRPEVSRLLLDGHKSAKTYAWHKQRAARVLEGWYSDRRFRTSGGQPLPLHIRGRRQSFESLVRKYGGDIPPKAVLQELLDARAISKTRAGLLRARRRTVARVYEPQAIAEIGTKTENYLRTLLHNLENPDNPWYERAVSRRRIRTALVPYIHREVAIRGDALLKVISDQLDRPRRDIKIKKGPRASLGVDFFFYLVPEARNKIREAKGR